MNTDNLYLCSCTVTVNELLQKKQFELKNARLNTPAGMLVIEKIQIVEKPSFIDYLRTGW